MNPYTKSTLLHVSMILVLIFTSVGISLYLDDKSSLYPWIVGLVSVLWFSFSWVEDRKEIKQDELRMAEAEQYRKENPELAAQTEELIRVFSIVEKGPVNLTRVTWTIRLGLNAIGLAILVWAWVKNWSALWSISPRAEQIWLHPLVLNTLVWSAVGLLVISLSGSGFIKEIGFMVYLQISGTDELQEWKRRAEERFNQQD